MPETDALVRRLKAYRTNQEKTQFEIACDMGISEDEISLLERSQTDPKLSTLQKIAAYMGVTVSNLLETGKE